MTSPSVGIINITNVLPAGTNIVITGVAGWRGTISGITFNNPAAQTVTLSIFRSVNTTTVDIYTFTLAAGDVVADNNTYILGTGDQIILTTAQPNTNFMMQGSWVRV